jgi:DinB superfamily
MKALGAELARVVDASEASLLKISEAESRTPIRPGGWSRKEMIGHLIDSASNNHQRFVRAALQDSLEFPAYDQEGCVRVEAPQEMPWPGLIALWASYNRYLAHVVAHLPEDKLAAECRIGAGDPVTLEFLARDYLRHLLHHLDQVR